MCGRFTLGQSGEAIAHAFQLAVTPDWQPRYNIAPTQAVPVIRAGVNQSRDFALLHWGLIPSWAKDVKMGARLINARAETLAEKPSFRHALKRRRCLVVADGFYEWHQQGRTKQPYFFSVTGRDIDRDVGREPFAFAGLWEHWDSAEGDSIESCTIITTAANALLATIHERMPVILPAEQYDQWLDPTRSGDEVRSLLQPYPPDAMRGYPVSPQVNSPRHDAPDCVHPDHGSRSLLPSPS